MLWLLRKSNIYRSSEGWMLFWFKLVVACSVMLGLVFWLNEPTQTWFAWGLLQRIQHLALMVGAAIMAYFLMLLLLGVNLKALLQDKHG
ncbi:hypothetical protein A3742_27220 [Oleiphilus sp. HI0071]|nr:hypothetical protein A3742_27220 [Oleiphilus sp. HI0071]